jgi:DNA-binding MarR family transcriptional regulator
MDGASSGTSRHVGTRRYTTPMCERGHVPAPVGRNAEDDTDPFELVAAIRRANHRLTARLDVDLLEMGVSFAQFEVMAALEREPGLHAGELGRAFGVTRQAIHRLLAQLDRAGLIDLLPRDHGVRAARVTDAGDRSLRHCRRALRETLEALARRALRETLEALARIHPETRNAARDALAVCERALVPRPGWYLD